MEELLNNSFYSFMFLLVGCVCLLLEIFVPSGGILGFLAVFSSGFGIFSLFYQDLYFAGFGSMVGFVGYAALMFYIIIKKITFKGAITPENSTSVDERLLLDNLKGVEGVTVTPLRPAGMALLNDMKVDVVSIGTFVEKDQKVRVVEIEGNRVVVRAI
jgi:membrane-bound serine protease (ClpP class)